MGGTARTVPGMPTPALLTAPADRAAGGSKIERGQFFTERDPFDHPAFQAWLDQIPVDAVLCEPFAGSKNLVRMMGRYRPDSTWVCFDIEPVTDDVIERDTIRDFPAGQTAVITNPPYLARNMAARKKMAAVVELCGDWDNLYKRALAECLTGSRWVAAIIPASFITAGQLTERLQTVISISENLFDDTEQPVCLALWGPAATSQPDFELWDGPVRLGRWSQLAGHLPTPAGDTARALRFNDRDGQIGLCAVDSTTGPTIRFCDPAEIDPAEIKVSSRHRTRIATGTLIPVGLEAAVIAAANRRLEALRDATGDIVLTAFMGVRSDGRLRRRLDFATARGLLAAAIDEVTATAPSFDLAA